MQYQADKTMLLKMCCEAHGNSFTVISNIGKVNS